MPNVRFVVATRSCGCSRPAYAADGGEASLVVVGGDASVGKTRLLAEVTGTLDALVLRGGCPPLGATGLPFSPIVEVLRAPNRTRSSSRGEPPIRIGHRLARAVLPPVTIRPRPAPSIGQTPDFRSDLPAAGTYTVQLGIDAARPRVLSSLYLHG
jgi:hypothetical protein